MNATEFLIRRGIYYDKVVHKGIKRFLYIGKRMVAFITHDQGVYGDMLHVAGFENGCWGNKKWIK